MPEIPNSGALFDTMPDVQPNALEADQAQRATMTAETETLRDAKGEPFDPAIHQVGPDGRPVLTATGKLKRKPGRRGGSSSPRSQVGTLSGSSGPVGSPEAQASQQATVAALHTAALVQGIGITIGGDEWKFEKDDKTGRDEEAHCIQAFQAFYLEKGVTEIPATVGLAIFAIAYAAPRFTKPKTQNRVKAGWYWLKSKFSKNGARTNRGHDNERKNDASNASRSPIQGAWSRADNSRPDARPAMAE